MLKTCGVADPIKEMLVNKFSHGVIQRNPSIMALSENTTLQKNIS
jgi:hypothetical protein